MKPQRGVDRESMLADLPLGQESLEPPRTPSSDKQQTNSVTQTSGCALGFCVLKLFFYRCLGWCVGGYPDTNRVIYCDDEENTFIIQNRRRAWQGPGRCGAHAHARVDGLWITHIGVQHSRLAPCAPVCCSTSKHLGTNRLRTGPTGFTLTTVDGVCVLIAPRPPIRVLVRSNR